MRIVVRIGLGCAPSGVFQPESQEAKKQRLLRNVEVVLRLEIRIEFPWKELYNLGDIKYTIQVILILRQTISAKIQARKVPVKRGPVSQGAVEDKLAYCKMLTRRYK